VSVEGECRSAIGLEIRQVDAGTNEPIEICDEGYVDKNLSLIDRPIYWHIVNVADKDYGWNTFVVTRDEATSAWGPEAAAYCDPATGLAFARIETQLPHRQGGAILLMALATTAFGKQHLKGAPDDPAL
jgi:hypothetical protein